MIEFYYYLVLLNGTVTFGAALAVLWKSRHQYAGQVLGVGIVAFSIWLVSYAQYFLPLSPRTAMTWAKITLTASFLNQPIILHGICAHVGKARKMRAWLILYYVIAVGLVVVLYTTNLVTGLRTGKDAAYMDHYVAYNRQYYQYLGLYYMSVVALGLGVLIRSAIKATGYRQTQLVYFTAAWAVVICTTYFVVVPIEYGIAMQPVGFFVLPINMAFLAYVLSKARLADYNVVIARVLLYVITLLVVVGASLLLIGGVLLVMPSFMNQAQVVFTVILVLLIGLALTISLPRLLPRAERIMQERMFSRRYGYQDTLGELVKELGHLSNIDELLNKAASTIHSQMQLSRVLILMQDSLSGDYPLQAESGLLIDETTDGLVLEEQGAIPVWLRERNDTLVWEELQRNAPAPIVAGISAELERLHATVCVPMIVDNQLAGMVCLGPKANNDMFFVSDLKVLGTLATEIGLAVRYHRMEDQIFRKNKLIELGTIAAGVAHEIRNPLASIRTFAQLLPDKMDDPEFTGEFSKLVLKDVDRITKVVESMLAFARPSQVTIAEHKAVELADEAVLLVQARLKSKRIELTKQYHEDPLLRVDRQQIMQVLVNLINNAVDALPEHGKIRVSVGVRALDGGYGENPNQKFAVIEVVDNGPGIPTAVRNRVFDPFFTTKKEGTGLGLSISQKIARDHGGIITVSSIEGKGTTFQVNLPVI